MTERRTYPNIPVVDLPDTTRDLPGFDIPTAVLKQHTKEHEGPPVWTAPDEVTYTSGVVDAASLVQDPRVGKILAAGAEDVMDDLWQLSRQPQPEIDKLHTSLQGDPRSKDVIGTVSTAATIVDYGGLLRIGATVLYQRSLQNRKSKPV